MGQLAFGLAIVASVVAALWVSARNSLKNGRVALRPDEWIASLGAAETPVSTETSAFTKTSAFRWTAALTLATALVVGVHVGRHDDLMAAALSTSLIVMLVLQYLQLQAIAHAGEPDQFPWKSTRSGITNGFSTILYSFIDARRQHAWFFHPSWIILFFAAVLAAQLWTEERRLRGNADRWPKFFGV